MDGLFNRRKIIVGLAAACCTLTQGAKGAELMAPDLSHLPPDRRAEAEALYTRMMAALPYERTKIAGADAATEWSQLSKLGRGWPVLIGDDEDLARIAEQYSAGDPAVFGTIPGLPVSHSTSDILKSAASIDFPKDLSKWPGAYRPEDLHADVGLWPATLQSQATEPDFSVVFNLSTGKVYDSAYVLFIPTEHSWEIPAYLRWGDWNACPPPEYHVAALRHWHDAYGAELVGINGDRMDLRVTRPPGERAEALAVAKEIYHYCPDIVDQGTETLSALAGTMVTGHSWNFWWD